MVRPERGARCDSCFVGCEARQRNGRWVFRCGHDLRRYAERQRMLGYPDDDREMLAALLRAMGGD